MVASEELRQPDIAQLVQVIENVRQARTGGGSPVKTSKAAKAISPATSKVSHSPEDRMLLKVNTSLLRLLEKLDKQGLKAVADQRFRRDMEVLQAEEEFIKSKSQL